MAPHPSNTAPTNTNTTTISLVQQNGGGRSSRSSRNSWLSEIDIKEENIEGDNGRIKMGDRNTDDRDNDDDRDTDNDDDDDNDDFVMANDQNEPPKKAAAAAAAEEKATQTEKETETEKETLANSNTNNNNNNNTNNNKPHSPVFELVTVNTASFGKSVIKCTICSNRRRACARLTADHGAVHWLTYHADGSEYLKTVDELQKLIMERLGEQ